MARPTTALVLGAGGFTGLAWEVGLLLGLHEAGVDVSGADIVVGSSAGAVVAAQLACGKPLAAMYDEQLAPLAEPVAGRFSPRVMLRYLWYLLLPGSSQATRFRLCQAALRMRTDGPVERIEEIVAQVQLPADWPDRRLLVTAVNADTGRLAAFGPESGVPLPTAVAASCAVPFVWPPVTAGGRPYVDGGIRSPTNADLAVGADSVVVVAPLTRSLSRDGRVSTMLARLGRGISTVVCAPDAASVRALGRDLLDPTNRSAAAQAGRAQGQGAAESVAAAWLGSAVAGGAIH